MYTRAQFILRAKRLLQELEADHEDQTGIAADEQHKFSDWLDELQNAEDNQ